MQIEWQIGPPSDWQTDAIIFFVFEKSPEPLPGLKRWMAEEGIWLSRSAALGDFKGKHQQTAVFYGPEDKRIARVVCVGLGQADKFDVEKLRSATAAALRECRDLQLSRPALPLSAFEGLQIEIAPALEEALIAGMLGLYRYEGLKTRDLEPSTFPETLLILHDKEPDEALRNVILDADAIASGVSFARDLVAAPPNVSTPSFLAGAARRLADRYGFRLDVLDLEKARAMGMGAFAAVAQGSREPAYFLVLEHAPPGTEQDHPLVLVGKGITFDTGGISLKPGEKMDAMKHDMAGAGAVLGTFDVLGRMKIKRRVVGLMPCTENMPDGKAYKPADVIRSLSGLTIEVISTDAEGRMVLCDALAYASRRYQPAMIVDIATLTGACVVALGRSVAAVMGNRDDLTQKVQEIGMRVGEKLWPLPLWDFYFENIKSDVADFKNVGERAAGTIIGGIFLKQFVPEEIPWVHLDIAGTAWTDKDLGFAPKGATGFGVRIFTEMVRRLPEL